MRLEKLNQYVNHILFFIADSLFLQITCYAIKDVKFNQFSMKLNSFNFLIIFSDEEGDPAVYRA